MPLTNFPGANTFAAGLTLRGLPLLQTQTGKVMWVYNGPPAGGVSRVIWRTVGGSDNNPGTFQKPFATLAYALSQCQQGGGDVIFIKPGHQEVVNGAGTTTAVTDPTGNVTVSAQTTIAFNVANVAVIGLGSGVYRPTFSFTTAATANILLQAANFSIQNCVFTAGFADIASFITGASASALTCTVAANTLTTGTTTGTIIPGMSVYSATAGKLLPGTVVLSQLTGTTGGAGTYQINKPQTVTSGTFLFGHHDTNIESCEFRDLSSVLNALTVFTAAATNANSHDGFRFVGNRISSLGTTAATTALVTAVGADRMKISQNFGTWAVLNDTAALLAAGAAQLTNLEIDNNMCERPNTSSTGGSFVSGSGNAWTGMAHDNYFYQVDGSAGIWIATGHGTSFGLQNNYSPITGAANISGLINPAAA